MIQDTLGPGFVLVNSRSLMGVHLCVFVQAPLIPLVSRISGAHVITGFFNKIGNKGAVGIGFKLGISSLLFVNCHLTSGSNEKKNKKRHLEIGKIEN
jgi:hypothetical protein